MKINVVVVEDYESDRRIVVEALLKVFGELGWTGEIYAAQGANDAYFSAVSGKSGRPADLVTLDSNLWPPFYGYRIARELRSAGFQGKMLAVCGVPEDFPGVEHIPETNNFSVQAKADVHGAVRKPNRRLDAVLGYDFEAALKTEILRLFPPENRV